MSVPDNETEEGVIWPGFFTRYRKIAAWTFLLIVSGIVGVLIVASLELLSRLIRWTPMPNPRQ
jgi:hypothetical protein